MNVRTTQIGIVAVVAVVLTAVVLALLTGGSTSDDDSVAAPTQDVANTPAVSSPTGSDSASPLPEPVQSAAPVVLDPDTDDVEAVVTAWSTAYATRQSPTDESWEETVAPWVGESLLEELSGPGRQEISHHAPTTVTEVQIGDTPIKEFGPDTPIRWSRDVTVTFTDQDGTAYRVVYLVQAFKGKDGWTITAAVFPGLVQPVE